MRSLIKRNLRLNFHLRLKLTTTQKYLTLLKLLIDFVGLLALTWLKKSQLLLFLIKLFYPEIFQIQFLDIASSFQSGKAVGFDKISMAIIKQSINAISQPLTHIINLSITHGIVTDEMKIARVIPLFKSRKSRCFHKLQTSLYTS
jgi:hypothetical protein